MAETSSGVVFERGHLGEEEEGKKEGRRKWGEEGGAPVVAMLHQRELQSATYAVSGGGEGERAALYSYASMVCICSVNCCATCTVL